MCHLLILGPGRPGWLVPRAVLHQPQLRPEEGGDPGGGGGAAVLALNLKLLPIYSIYINFLSAFTLIIRLTFFCLMLF